MDLSQPLVRLVLVSLLGLHGVDPTTSYYRSDGGYSRKEVVVTNEDR